MRRKVISKHVFRRRARARQYVLERAVWQARNPGAGNAVLLDAVGLPVWTTAVRVEKASRGPARWYVVAVG